MEGPAAAGVDADATAVEQRLRTVIEAAPNAMVLVDSVGRIVLVNSEAVRLFGHPREDLLGMSVDRLVPTRHAQTHRALRSAYLEAPTRRAMGEGRELFGLRADGTEIPIEIGLNPITYDDETLVLASIIDITGRVAARARAEDDLLRSMIDSIPLCVLATDRTGVVVAANPGAEALLGLPGGALVDRPVSDFEAAGPARDTDEVHGSDLHLPARVGTQRETRYQRADGSTVEVAEWVSVLRDRSGSVTGYLLVANDITARVQAEEAVQRMTTHDALTNLPNRLMLERHLANAISDAARHRASGALLLLDLDHIKTINDSLGHHVGDQVILEVADRLRRWAADRFPVFRFGGDEFVIVAPDDRSVPRLSATLSEALTAPMSVQGHELVTRFSVGVARFPEDGSDPAELLQHADTAMYYAKAAGRDRLQWFDPSMRAETNDRLFLASALEKALRDGEISVAYQPQVELSTGLTIGFEALARWESPTLGRVGPERFIPVAEDTGMILELGATVLEQACADIRRIQDELGRPLRVSVNVSPRQFGADDWVHTVLSVLERTGLAPSQLELEITEGVLIDDRWQVSDGLRRLRDAGITIAIDDFGLGYSSLAYLTRFPVDRLKIDRAFMEEVGSGAGNAPIVDAIVVMAHALGLSVLAEGVETNAQDAYLRQLGCDEGQGFLYSPPVTAAAAVAAAGGV